MTIFQKQDQKTILNLTIHHQHVHDFLKTSSMIVRTVTPLFCVGLLRQNWTFCGRRLYSCLVAREKITITFVERFICLLLVSNLNLLSKSKSLLFICLLLVSNLNLLSKSKSLLFTNFTSYILPSSTKNEGGGVTTRLDLCGYSWM
jgi:hypothetical protein